MLKVQNSVKIPLKFFINKGSQKERIEYAQKLNEHFYQAIQAKMVCNALSVDEYKRTLKEVLPENIKFNFKTYVKKFLGHDDAYVLTITNKYNEAEKFEIQIPCRKNASGERTIDKKDNKLSMHETFHMFVEMSNPKFIARCDFNDTEYRFYESWIYNRNYSKFNLKKNLEWNKKLKEFLAHKKTEKQIDFLQNCRYRLLEEKLAYKEGEKYGKDSCMLEAFHFDKKTKIIKKILYKTIKKARKEN